MHPLDAAIVLAFVIYAIRSGLRSRKQASTGMEEYFLAGRSLTGLQAGLSMAATQFSADTPLLVAGLIATAGVFSLWRLWIYALAFLLLGFVLAPAWRRAGVLTDAELSEARYGSRFAATLRVVKAVYFGVVFNCAVLAMVLFAAARITEPFLTWHVWLPARFFEPLESLVAYVHVPLSGSDIAGSFTHTTDNLISLSLILALTAGYSTTGGLRAVVRTDVLQLGLALLGSALYAVYAVQAAGGLDDLRTRLGPALASSQSSLSVDALLAFEPSQAAEASLPVLATLGLQWLLQMNADGTGYLAQRCMACRSDSEARRATLVFAFTQVGLRSLLWLPIGVSLCIALPAAPGLDPAALSAEREATFVLGMQTLLPVGIRGLLLTAMLAALASTLDTHLNWGASYLTNDLFRPWYRRRHGREPRARKLVQVARLSNPLLVLLSLLLMTQLDSIQRAWHVTLLLGAGMGVMLVLRWVWWRITALGELSAMASSLVGAPLWLTWLPEPREEPLRMLCMATLSTSVGVLVSLYGPPENPTRLRRFFQRVHPPGHWSPQARALGESPSVGARRLRWGIASTVTAALSLFCALVAVGTWLVDGTTPRGLPSRGAWIFGLLLGAMVFCALAFHCTGRLRDRPPTTAAERP